MKNKNLWKPTKFQLSNQKLLVGQAIGLSSRRMAQYIADFYNGNIPKYCTGRLLDLGCGTVPFYGLYKDFVNNITCVDWNNSLHDNSHVDFYCDLNNKIPLEDNSSDTIIMSDVIEHLTDPLLIFKEAWRMLAPGGKLLFNYPFMYGLHEIPHDYCRYTHYYIQQLSIKTGFGILERVQFGGSFDIIENLILKSARQQKGGRYIEKVFFYFFNFIYKGKIRLISNANLSKHPFGYGFVLMKKIEIPNESFE